MFKRQVEWEPITIRDVKGRAWTVPGIAVDVPHLPGWRFVAHKSLTLENDWNVSEASTGFAVLKDGEEPADISDAIDDALEVLAKITPEVMSETAEKARQKLLSIAN